MIKYIKSVLWRAAKRLSYIEDSRCLSVKVIISTYPFGCTVLKCIFYEKKNVHSVEEISSIPQEELISLLMQSHLNYFYCFELCCLLFWIVLFIVFFLSIVLFYVLPACKSVLYYCHRLSTQLQLNIPYYILCLL